MGTTAGAIRGGQRQLQTLVPGTEGSDTRTHTSHAHTHMRTQFLTTILSVAQKMKKKSMVYSGLSDEVDFNVPNYKTVISISSLDQLNITLSKCGLTMLSNLGVVRISVYC